VRYSAKTRYAALAMIELALRHDAREPVQVRCIAGDHGIPAQFLVQILSQLKAAGLVVSTRGSAGGYQLARPPEEVTLGEVVEAVEGEEELPADDHSPLAYVLNEVWQEAARRERELVHGISLAELAEQSRARSNAMYYI
jgi:Rrf2 family protein